MISIVNAVHKIAALIGGPVSAITQGQLPTTLREILAIAGPAYAAIVHILDKYIDGPSKTKDAPAL